MDVEMKRKWVEALRGGQFKQGRSLLYTAQDNSYCCLGVLCQVTDGRQRYGVVSDARIEQRLIDMNDGSGGFPQHSFSEIADYIDANL